MTGTREDGWNKEIVISKLMGEHIEKRGESRGREKRRIAGNRKEWKEESRKGVGERRNGMKWVE